MVVDAIATGGQAATSSQIENYLGFPAGISGADLADRAVVQARKFGAALLVPAEAQSLGQVDGHYAVGLTDGERVEAHAVVLATGVRFRRLDVPGMERFEDPSVYYAATEFEARLCRGDAVVIVGGGNSAGQAALFLARTAAEVHLVIRHGELDRDMSRYLAERIRAADRVRLWLNTAVRELRGGTSLEEVVVRDVATGEERALPATALFVLIGSEPTPGGSTERSRSTAGGSLSPTAHEAEPCSRPRGRESSRWGMCGADQCGASPRRWARAPWRCAWSTSIWSAPAAGDPILTGSRRGRSRRASCLRGAPHTRGDRTRRTSRGGRNPIWRPPRSR